MELEATSFEGKKDWFDELNEEQQTDFIESLAEADGGETIPHSEVGKLFRIWGLKQIIGGPKI